VSRRVAEPPKGVVSVQILARVLCCTPRNVQQLARDGVLPKGLRGQYELVPCVQAYIKHLREVAAGRKSDGEKGDLVAERARLDSARADAQEMRNEQMRRELIPRQALLPAFQNLLVAFKTRLRSLHVRVRDDVPGIGRAGAQLIRQLHDEALSELANGLESIGSGERLPGQRSDSASAAESDA
jgi:phage terminase Nu1 subunit (DNA packaging protein)